MKSPFSFIYDKGQWFWKANGSNSLSPKIVKERDKPAFKAVYGIEAHAKAGMDSAVAKALREIKQKLMS